MTDVDTMRQAVLKLLKAGECTVAEAARLAGQDRQLVHYWAHVAGVKAPPSRATRLKQLWRDSLTEASSRANGKG